MANAKVDLDGEFYKLLPATPFPLAYSCKLLCDEEQRAGSHLLVAQRTCFAAPIDELRLTSKGVTHLDNIEYRHLNPSEPMAQAKLEEIFKGIGLAEATAKCGVYQLAILTAHQSLQV